MTTDLTPDMQAVALTLMEGLDTPRSLAIAMMVRHREWVQLANMAVDPSLYTDPELLWRDSMATDFLRKCADFAEPSSLDAATFNKWLWAEQQCKRTNQRLSLFDLPEPCLQGSEVEVMRIIRIARKTIERIIGASPPQFLNGRFGPGATVSDPSTLASIPDKMTSTPTFTPSAWLELVPWSGTAWASACAELGTSPKSVRGNTYFTVRKDAKILRACAKEPSINGFYQLGVGTVWKDCLKLEGIDLYHGQQVHRWMACWASIEGTHATIDLTSASDTNCKNLVKLLLPRRWFELVSRLRSPLTKVGQKWYMLEKFSSMGNGFTFELETLIFYAIIKALRPDYCAGIDVFVYGDDLIVPTECAQDVLAALKYFGFTPNAKKTFVNGPFRESCGEDFFGGVRVRAAFIEELPYEPQHYISIANSLRRACKEAGVVSPGRFNRVMRAWFKCLDCLPSNIRNCRGPEGLGDQVVHDAEERWKTRWRNSIRYVRCYRPRLTHKVRWEGYAYCVQFAAALYRTPTNLPTRVGAAYPRHVMVASRQSSMSYKVGWTPHS